MKSEARDVKSEARSPKSEANPKLQIPSDKAVGVSVSDFGSLDLGFASGLGFRASDCTLRWPVLFALACILTIALGMRLYQLDAEGLWLDEFFSLEISSGRGFADQALPRQTLMHAPLPALTTLAHAPPWTAIWATMRQDCHPPLYFLLLRGWRVLFGDADWTLRFFSVLTSLACVIMLFRVGNTLYGATAALWACLLMAVAVPQIVYAREARHYPLLVLTSLCCAEALIWTIRCGATIGYLSVLSIAILLMMLTHFYCIGVVLGMGAYVLIVLRGRVRLRVLGAFAAAGLAFAILWGPILLQQREAFARWHGSDQGQPNTVAVKFQRLGVAPMRQLTAVFDGSTTHAAICAAVCVSGVLLLWKRRELWLWWLWAFGVMGVLAAHDFLGSEDHLVLPKYALAAGPAIFLLIAAGAQRLPLRSARAQKIATHLIPAAAVLLCLSDASVAYAPYRGNWRDPGRWILEHATGSDAVVFCSAFRRGRSDGWSYLSLFHYTDTAIMPCPVMLLDEPGAHGAAIDQLRGARTVFVVIDSPTDTPESWLRGCRPLVGVYFPHSAAVWAVRMGTPMKSQATDVKSQARNPKSEKKSPVVRGVGIWGSGFASDFGLRISDLQGP